MRMAVRASTATEDMASVLREDHRRARVMPSSCSAVRWRRLSENEQRLAEDDLDSSRLHVRLRCERRELSTRFGRARAQGAESEASSKEAGVGGADLRRRKSMRLATCVRPKTCSVCRALCARYLTRMLDDVGALGADVIEPDVPRRGSDRRQGRRRCTPCRHARRHSAAAAT